MGGIRSGTPLARFCPPSPFFRDNRLHVRRLPFVNACMRAFPGLLLLASGVLDAQGAVTFEAAYIQLDTSSDRPGGEYKNGRLIIHNHSLRSLVGAAYHVPNVNIQGPGWLDDVRFDISAKTEPAVTEEASRVMLQTLLSEQLKLEIHREEKVESAYSMVLAGGALKLHEAPSDAEKITNCSVMKRGELTCSSVSLESFAKFLGSFVGDGSAVRDGTGFKGQYEIHLTWTEGPSGPTLFEALQKQLGLKLQGRKLQIEYIVVDHVERVPLDR
uniref:Peptidase M56, BlaR1 n=1 Tax=Solibacter usitatus (strain Ellin6076) TaxID=234267 RepID=Q027T5_SOLUE